MAKVGVVAIDLDGTLITCAPRQIFLFAALARGHGYAPDLEKFWRLKRNGNSTHSSSMLAGLPEAVGIRVAAQWISLIETPFWLALDRCHPDSIETLIKLRAANYKLIVITARQHKHWLNAQLSRLRLDCLVDAVFVVDPRDAAGAKARLLREHSTICFIGDTETDAAAAGLARTRFVALDRGQRDAEFLRQRNVPNVVADLETAAQFLDLVP